MRISTTDEVAYMIEMTPWIEEWSDRIAQVIGEEEDEGISLPQYEERGNRFSCTEHDLVAKERDLIVGDPESLQRDLEGMREVRDMAVAELERVRTEAERVQVNLAKDRCHELLEDVKRLIDKSGKLSILLLGASGDPSLADANPYVWVSLPSFAGSQSRSRASTQMLRGQRQV
ncbi:hypothetical protein AMTR_s00027p00133550 [Amborella trichopoda]|uniref:Uncharacterized protein n=1 Tax=Amborella trichopoda TaxID=13333 RepID=W1PSD0_AMBTC|nr:hypothetical protein AMTR_s00027p00133550 [Amborella trichopoda]